MRVALMYHAKLPVRGYGGTERVVTWLGRGLAELGPQVTLLAAPGSRVDWARVVPIDRRAAGRAGFDVRPHLPAGLDVVHAHQEIAPAGLPWLWTLHGNARSPRTFPDTTVGLSADHAARHRLSAWVHNGLDPAEFTFQQVKGDYDLFLGRLHSVKGWQWAMAGARRADRRLVVAGGWRPTLGSRVRFVGTVDGESKRTLLAGARLLWSPVQWDEPFGLTTIEALASGTPVLGTRRGALPEIVTPEVGVLGETLEELVGAIPRAAACDPAACRARVETHFHYRVMAERYVALYREAIAGYRDA
jgi:hypothetical protein